MKIRAALGLYSNLRPAKLFPALAGACPLRKDIAEKGIDLVVVRELIGGIYFGERGRGMGEGGEFAYDTEKYSVEEIERIARIAFDLAMQAAASTSPPSTRRTCSNPPACGARWCTTSPKSTPKWS